MEEIQEKLSMLDKACESGSDEEVKKSLREKVPTYPGSAINQQIGIPTESVGIFA